MNVFLVTSLICGPSVEAVRVSSWRWASRRWASRRWASRRRCQAGDGQAALTMFHAETESAESGDAESEQFWEPLPAGGDAKSPVKMQYDLRPYDPPGYGRYVVSIPVEDQGAHSSVAMILDVHHWEDKEGHSPLEGIPEYHFGYGESPFRFKVGQSYELTRDDLQRFLAAKEGVSFGGVLVEKSKQKNGPDARTNKRDRYWNVLEFGDEVAYCPEDGSEEPSWQRGVVGQLSRSSAGHFGVTIPVDKLFGDIYTVSVYDHLTTGRGVRQVFPFKSEEGEVIGFEFPGGFKFYKDKPIEIREDRSKDLVTLENTYGRQCDDPA